MQEIAEFDPFRFFPFEYFIRAFHPPLIREAAHIAMTGEHACASLKKEFDQLVCDGSKAGGAQITVGHGETYAFNVPAGKFAIIDGLPAGEVVDIALNGQRFASMPAEARHTFPTDQSKRKLYTCTGSSGSSGSGSLLSTATRERKYVYGATGLDNVTFRFQ